MKTSELVSLARRHAGAILAILTLLIGVVTAIALPTQHSSGRSSSSSSQLGSATDEHGGYVPGSDLGGRVRDVRLTNDSTIELAFTTGTPECYEPFTELEETDSSVTVRFGTRTNLEPGVKTCLDVGLTTEQTIKLSKPLDDRPLYLEEVGEGGLKAAPEDFKTGVELVEFDSAFRVDLKYLTGNPICYRPEVKVKESTSRIDVHLRVVDRPGPDFVQCRPASIGFSEFVFFDKPRDNRPINVTIDDLSGRTTGTITPTPSGK